MLLVDDGAAMRGLDEAAVDRSNAGLGCLDTPLLVTAARWGSVAVDLMGGSIGSISIALVCRLDRERVGRSIDWTGWDGIGLAAT